MEGLSSDFPNILGIKEYSNIYSACKMVLTQLFVLCRVENSVAVWRTEYSVAVRCLD